MSVYVCVAPVGREITDWPTGQEDMDKVKATVAAHGGSYRAVGGEQQVLEGDWNPRFLILIEFPDMASAQGWYGSDAYQALKRTRQSGSRADAVLLAGVEEGPPRPLDG